eukprot:6476762-Amphidinium_carterae.1
MPLTLKDYMPPMTRSGVNPASRVRYAWDSSGICTLDEPLNQSRARVWVMYDRSFRSDTVYCTTTCRHCVKGEIDAAA